MTTLRGWTWIIVFLVTICSLRVEGQGTRPLGKGIQDVTDRIAKNKLHISELEGAVQGYVLEIGKVIYTAYGQEQDPGRILVDLKQTMEQHLETVEAARTGQGNAAQIGQIILDDWSKLNPVVKNIDASQKIAGQLAPLIETLWERNNYQQQISSDTQILGNLRAESASLSARNAAPSTVHVDAVQPQTRTVDFSPLDDAVLLSRWLDIGNRAFANPREEDAFYKRYPTLERFKTLAETMSPRTDVERAGLIRAGSPQLSMSDCMKTRLSVGSTSSCFRRPCGPNQVCVPILLSLYHGSTEKCLAAFQPEVESARKSCQGK